MVEVEIGGEQLEVEVRGWAKLLAFKNRVVVPLHAVRAVRRLEPDEIRGWWKGLRVPGTHVPGVIVAGSYYRRGEWHFWCVRRPDRALEIQLSPGRYDRLFVEVADREHTLEVLSRAGIPVLSGPDQDGARSSAPPPVAAGSA